MTKSVHVANSQFSRAVREGTFRLQLPAATAFGFFSPEGERSWVPEWEPRYFTENTAPVSGLVFETDAGGERTLWIVLDYDAARHRAHYVRVVPDSRMGTVEVRCEVTADGETDVRVIYDLTALSDAGETVLRELTPAAYQGMLRSWQLSITRAAGGGGSRS